MVSDMVPTATFPKAGTITRLLGVGVGTGVGEGVAIGFVGLICNSAPANQAEDAVGSLAASGSACIQGIIPTGVPLPPVV